MAEHAIMEAPKSPHVRTFPSTPSSQSRHAVFGFRLPYLPDLLSDHTLLGQSDAERVSEILNRWTQFILGLRKWQNSAFALRYDALPDRGAIQVSILGRSVMSTERTRQTTTAVAADLAAQLTAFGFRHTALDERGLHEVLFPFEEASHIVEVRQHEEVTPFLVTSDEAYVVHPYWFASGSWLLPFEAMLRQTTPVTASIYLEPTTLTQVEEEGLIRAAQIARTLSDQMVRAHSDMTAAQRRDPQAEMVSRIYAELRRQLVEPFLLLLQVASPDGGAAWNVARSLGAAITSDHHTPVVSVDERDLPSGFDLWAPREASDAAASKRCFTQLNLSPWGDSQASEDKRRLPYLVGARGAAAAFRVPISVRGGIPGIAVRQPAPDFEPGPRPATAGSDELHLGNFRRGGAVTIKLAHLSRHTLITGFTGAGKTNTVLYLLDQLWRRHGIPFLVIEAAKKEYRGFAQQRGFEDVLVFSLGDETASPFRLNPFELLPGVRLEAHLGRLQTCFDAALPQFGILPSIIAESLERVYRDKGWSLTVRGSTQQDRLFPTMRDMYAKVMQVAEARGYAGETYHNIRAAAAGRIGSLLQGSRGRMFGCQRSIPLELVMTQPTILELNDLNQQDKALTMMFLLMLLREYRELHKGKKLQHVTVVEEAHNVMENVQSVGASEIAADTRAKAVEAFAAMLSEVRAYGEGIIISDQSPDKLAPDAVRNTNLQIAHQLRHRVDREAIAAAMIMSEAQRDYLGKLRVGEAAVFLTGYDRATFMRVPNYKDDAEFPEPDDTQVAAHMAAFKAQHLSNYLPFDGCRFCGSPCEYREVIEPYTADRELTEKFQQAVQRFDEHPEAEYWRENWSEVATACIEAASRSGNGHQLDAAWCYLAHEIDFLFTEHMRRHFAEAHERIGD